MKHNHLHNLNEPYIVESFFQHSAEHTRSNAVKSRGNIYLK